MMIKIGSKVKIKFLSKNVIQDKIVVSPEYYAEIKANMLEYSLMSYKQQKKYKKKKSLDHKEFIPDSPMGRALMGKSEGDIGIMELPQCQGGKHSIEILSVND